MHNIVKSSSLPLAEDQRLLAMIRDIRLPGAVSYHYDRPPGYTAFAKTQGTHFEVFKAIEDETLLGFTQISYEQVSWNNKPSNITYSGDTRVSEKARGKKISDSLIHAACSQPSAVFGAVLKTNKVILEKKLKDWDKVGVHFKEIAEGNIFLYRPANISLKRRDKLLCRVARSSDLPAMYFVWKQYASTRNLVRTYHDLPSFTKSYEDTPGISLERTILIFDGVSLIAMLSLWDQSSIRKVIIDQKNILMKIVSKIIPLPEVGEELKLAFSFQHAFLEDYPSCDLALETLIAKARTLSLEMGAHFFSLGCDRKDPQLAVFKKAALITNTVKIILDPRGNEEFMQSDFPLHLDIGIR